MRRLIVSPSVTHDMDAIWWFVGRESEASADRLIDKIVEAFDLLREMPGIGHRHPSIRRPDELCWSVRGTWLIIYIYSEDQVEGVRVVSGRRDWRTIVS